MLGACRDKINERGYYAKSSQGPGSLKISGKTEDGKFVIKGTFFIVSSMGMPLEYIVDILHKKNMIVDWLNFYEDSIKEGWKSERTMERIRHAIGDIFGSEFGEESLRRLKKCVSYKNGLTQED